MSRQKLISGCSYMSKSILEPFQNSLQYSAGAAITVIALIDQINVLNRDTSPHMISHSYVHSGTFECMHVSIHTYTSLASVDPLWGQEHQCPCGFLPYGIMLGRYFCLLGWLLDMVFIWIGNLFSFESIYSTGKRRGRPRRGVAIRSAHRSALTWRTWVDSGRLEEVERGKCISSHYWCLKTWKNNHHLYSWWKCCLTGALECIVFAFKWSQNIHNPAATPGQNIFVFICTSIFLYLGGINSRKLFSVDRLPTSAAKGRLIKCHQSEMRVKWTGKSWIFTLIWLTPGGLQSLMAALICIVLCAPHPFPLTINSFNTFALI